MDKKLTVCWLSAGVSSFIGGYLEKDKIDRFIYIHIDDQHPDTLRFVHDCESILQRKVDILQSSEYKSVEEACLAFGGFGNIRTGFYCCTNWLKKRVRKQWEAEHSDYEIAYVWGMDQAEVDRARKLEDSMSQYGHIFPLIERNINKQEAHAICYNLGVKRPIMYDLGYQNNNCVGCVKGGMGYWNKIRVDFPEIFERRSKLERKLGKTILKDYDGSPIYLDELDPGRGRYSSEISQDCDIFCMLNI